MKKHPRIVVIGSSNSDMVARTPRLPRPGETVLGETFAVMAGGKGANQAVAAARLGGQVTFIARLGRDILGDNAIVGFQADGIDTSLITRDPEASTGVALIGVDATRGENFIIVVPGANAKLSVDDIELCADAIRAADIVVCQLETPMETVEFALKMAHEAGVPTILNPAPAQMLPESLLAYVTVLTPNETEAAILVGDTTAAPEAAAARLRNMGVERVVVTLGSAGALISTADGNLMVPGCKISNVVDTTAAGDCFTGALAVALAEGSDLAHAAAFANAAAALSVTKPGAQASLPTREEVDGFVKSS